jgi:hypothetical protein
VGVTSGPTCPGSGNTFTIGTTPVQCTASDAAGNAGFASFSVTVEDTTPPDINCAAADGAWHASDVSIACTASDGGSGLTDAADAAFLLWTDVPAGTETNNAVTGSYQVCDVVGNCSTAGPVSGNQVDKKATVIDCAAADGTWYAVDVSIACTGADNGSGLADPAESAFLLWTAQPVDTETDDAPTNTLNVCDTVGNCTTAGPIAGNKVDKKAPVITIVQPAPTEYAHSATLVLAYTVTDNGIGVDSVTPMLNGSTTLAGHGLENGQSIYLLTELQLGNHNFSINATDLLGQASGESTTFSVIATPQSIIDAVNYYDSLGLLDPLVMPAILDQLDRAMRWYDRGFCRQSQSNYRKSINALAEQRDGENAAVTNDLIADLTYLMRNCPA